MAIQTGVMTIKWTNPAGSSDGQKVQATLQLFPDVPEDSKLLISKWVAIYDLYKGKNTTIGGKLRLKVYGTQPLIDTDDVLNLDPANPSRPKIDIIVLPPNVMLTADVFVNANTGTTDATETAEAKFVLGDSYDEIIDYLRTQGILE